MCALEQSIMVSGRMTIMVVRKQRKKTGPGTTFKNMPPGNYLP
jgi:hypothetical protein